MDPEVCLRELVDLLSEAKEKAEHLTGWIGNGGFVPGPIKESPEVTGIVEEFISSSILLLNGTYEEEGQRP